MSKLRHGFVDTGHEAGSFQSHGFPVVKFLSEPTRVSHKLFQTFFLADRRLLQLDSIICKVDCMGLSTQGCDCVVYVGRQIRFRRRIARSKKPDGAAMVG
ncbi:hypothetical protein CGGC5_v005960 [Colletotrichum fructicola Nara gc5]|uniref:Uncharacterized protein n=1 Tax=Colletotrichum fructicola (strain Nara gc5) TaxID=1213859 RepID=A0A7J6JFM1_COLFN|nr:hypothetical protein CGGC5_v005960 [Colletotrichum fructicola Nara gc5]